MESTRRLPTCSVSCPRPYNIVLTSADCLLSHSLAVFRRSSSTVAGRRHSDRNSLRSFDCFGSCTPRKRLSAHDLGNQWSHCSDSSSFSLKLFQSHFLSLLKW